VEDIQHWRRNQSDEEIVYLRMRYDKWESTQLEAVLIATPLARRRVGNISDGRVHAIGPHETPYESVKKSKIRESIEREYRSDRHRYFLQLFVLANLALHMLPLSPPLDERLSSRSTLTSI
jgi:hypothetical protein